MKSNYWQVEWKGIRYAVLICGGHGWTIGGDSVLEVLNGENVGKLVRADIWGGVLNIRFIEPGRDLSDHEKRLLTLGRSTRSNPPSPEYE